MPITYQVVEQRSSTVPVGEVISQDPPAETIEDPNADVVVTLYVSSGPSVGSFASFGIRQYYAVFAVA